MNDEILFAPDDSDELILAPDDDTIEAPNAEKPGHTQPADDKWRVLIVDDEPDVHRMTKVVLKTYNFDGRELDLHSAYSAAEAMKIIKEQPDFSVVLLDVVMETDDAGLRVAKYVREELDNQTVQIILRTGQPGMAPEEEVMVKFEINDYKAKTELTSKKLSIALTSSLRAYRLANSLGLALDKVAEELTRRKAAEDELAKLLDARTSQLKESESRYQALFQSMMDAVLVFEFDQMLDCNPAALKLFGCAAREQLIGREWSSFFAPTANDRKKGEQIWDAAQNQHRSGGETRLCRKDGTEFDAEVALGRVANTDDPMYLAVTRDITFKKKADDALRTSYQRMAQVNDQLQEQRQQLLASNPLDGDAELGPAANLGVLQAQLKTAEDHLTAFNTALTLHKQFQESFDPDRLSDENRDLLDKIGDFSKEQPPERLLVEIQTKIKEAVEEAAKVQKMISELGN